MKNNQLRNGLPVQQNLVIRRNKDIGKNKRNIYMFDEFKRTIIKALAMYCPELSYEWLEGAMNRQLILYANSFTHTNSVDVLVQFSRAHTIFTALNLGKAILFYSELQQINE